MNKETLREYALRGARAKLAELMAETTAILADFPELAKTVRKAKAAGTVEAKAREAWEERTNGKAAAEPAAKEKRGRGQWTPAQRKMYSRNMKRRWREAKAKGMTPGGLKLRKKSPLTGRKVSAAARKNMRAAAKARGERIRAENAAAKAAENRVPV